MVLDAIALVLDEPPSTVSQHMSRVRQFWPAPISLNEKESPVTTAIALQMGNL
jgi:hypothetical protein